MFFYLKNVSVFFRDHVPFISKMSHTKLIFRAVMQNDLDMLKKLLEDEQHIHDVSKTII